MDVAAQGMTHTASPAPAADLQARFHAQRLAFAADRFPDAATRRGRLERMRRLVEENEQRFASAISADFGNRSRHETVIAETFFVLAGISHTRGHDQRRSAAHRSVFEQSRLATAMLWPPFGRKTSSIVNALKRLL